MLDEGILAPDFEMQSILGEMIQLSNYLGKKVLLCFTKDTVHENKDMNLYALVDWAYQEFLEMNVMPICVCPMSIKEIPPFYKMIPLLTPMIPDEHGSITRLYDVEVNRVTFGKTYHIVKECAYLISEDGYIEKQFKKFHYQTGMKQVITFLEKQKSKSKKKK